jgi:hypothetical protein
MGETAMADANGGWERGDVAENLAAVLEGTEGGAGSGGGGELLEEEEKLFEDWVGGLVDGVEELLFDR